MELNIGYMYLQFSLILDGTEHWVYILAVPLIIDGTEHWVYVLAIFPYHRWN